MDNVNKREILMNNICLCDEGMSVLIVNKVKTVFTSLHILLLMIGTKGSDRVFNRTKNQQN